MTADADPPRDPTGSAPSGSRRLLSDHPFVVLCATVAAIATIMTAIVGLPISILADLRTLIGGPSSAPPSTMVSLSRTPVSTRPPVPRVVAWLGDRSLNSTAVTDIGIAVVDNHGGWSGQIAEEIVKSLAAERAGMRTVRLTRAFVADGSFASLFDGDLSVLNQDQLSKHLDWLLLLKVSADCSRHREYTNIHTCRATAEGRYLDVRAVTLSQSTRADTAGAGGSPEEARAQAWERIAVAIASDAP